MDSLKEIMEDEKWKFLQRKKIVSDLSHAWFLRAAVATFLGVSAECEALGALTVMDVYSDSVILILKETA